jgi:hypothetical protein
MTTKLLEMWLPIVEVYDIGDREKKELLSFLLAPTFYLSHQYRLNDETGFGYFREIIEKIEIEPKPEDLFLELGVFTAATTHAISRVIKEKKWKNKLYGFDCFTGLPEPWRDLTPGTFALKELPAVPENVELIDGLFSDTLPSFVQKNKNKKISLLHLDADLYSSTMTAFEHLHKLFRPGTIIAFDEFALWPSFCGDKAGEFEALLDCSEKYGFKYEYVLRGWDAKSRNEVICNDIEWDCVVKALNRGDADDWTSPWGEGLQFLYWSPEGSPYRAKMSAREKAVIRITEVKSV